MKNYNRNSNLLLTLKNAMENIYVVLRGFLLYIYVGLEGSSRIFCCFEIRYLLGVYWFPKPYYSLLESSPPFKINIKGKYYVC